MEHGKNKRNNKRKQEIELIASEANEKEEEKVIQEKEYDIGFDVSTAVTGYSIIDRYTKELIEFNFIKLNTVELDNMWKKADYVKEEIEKINLKYPNLIKRIFVEENLKMFTPGFSSASTIITLAKFNAITCFIARGIFKAEVVDVNVSSARKALGIKIDKKNKSLSTKEKTFNQVLIILNNSELWPKHVAKTGKHKGQTVYDTCCRDMSDAYVITRGGQLLHGEDNRNL